VDGGAAAVVLVEGESDRGAVQALARRLGHDPGGSGVVIDSMEGVTTVRRFLRVHDEAILVAVLCDAGEVDYVHRAIADETRDVAVFVCDRDLEDELIRAVGLEWMVEFIDRQGELSTFRLMQRQPAQRDRSLEQHVHRFMGIRSGRKIRYATEMVDQIPLDVVPEPLAGVVRYLFEDSGS